MKVFASLFALLFALAAAPAAHASSVGSYNENWFMQLPAQAIVLMMAGFVVWGFVKKRVGGQLDK